MNFFQIKKNIFDFYGNMNIYFRLFSLGVILFLIWILWQEIFFFPLKNIIIENDKAAYLIEVQIIQDAKNIIIFQNKVNDLHFKKYFEIKLQLDQELSQLIKKINFIQAQSITIGKISDVTSAILQAQQDVSVVSVRNLPAETWLNSMPKDISLPVGAKEIRRYPISIVFQGDFFHTVHYIHQLTQLPWQINWRTFTYQVIKWPQATILLDVDVFGKTEK